MFGAFRKQLLLVALMLPVVSLAQTDGCFGETFVQLYKDEGGRDVRTTAIISFPGPAGDQLLGGTVGGNIFLSRISNTGMVRWRRVFQTPSESTELSTLNALLIDQEGMIAGVGATFNNNLQKAFLFRYDPIADQLRYFLQPPFESMATAIQETTTGNYLIAGNKQDEASPIFISAYLVEINPATGAEVRQGTRYDYRGDESFLDLEITEDGTLFAAGNISATGGSGDIRASISCFAADGAQQWTQIGPIRPTANGRLLAFDVEVVGNKVYVLHWGNIGAITGGPNTTVQLSRMNVSDGTLDWTYTYDLVEYEGESAIEIQHHDERLFLSGFSLIGKRDPWLMVTDLEGREQWATGYELPGNATVFFRANQQLLVDNGGITALATFSHTTGRAREGMVLRVTHNGSTTNDCIDLQTLSINRSSLANGWVAIDLEENPLPLGWTTLATNSEPSRIAVFDDCDQSCDGCLSTNFKLQYLCAGDSINLNGIFRTEAGIYIDTLPGSIPGCDSLLITELQVNNGPSATFSTSQPCGFATAEVRITVSDGIPPYQYTWSTPQATGSTVFLQSGIYQVTITDSLDCQPVVLDIAVEALNTDGLSYQIIPPVCPGDSTGRIELSPAGRGSARLLPTGGFTPDGINNLAAGEYFIVLRNEDGCEAFRQITIPEPAPVGISINGPAFSRLGQEVSLIGQASTNSNFSSYQWRGTEAIICDAFPIARLSPVEDSWVYLEAATVEGCIVQDSFLLRVPDDQARLYTPTAFSPNGDGLNDLWKPLLGSDIQMVEECNIYNRWGGIVFSYLGDEEWWTGQDQPAGTYLYQLTVTLINGKRVSRTGELLLLR
ncbi:MAG: gliding motility-associated C-terminal domain-containing protein [Bacteroidota bacterium]